MPDLEGAEGVAKGRFTDAHCHLNDTRLESLRAKWIEEAEAVGIQRFILGGIGPEEWARQGQLLDEYPGKFVSVCGVHPWWVARHADADWKTSLTALEKRLEHTGPHQPRGIGETGLDHSEKVPASTHARQQACFEATLVLARRYPELPLVLHVVRAHEATLQILKAERAARAALPSPIEASFRGIVHSFSGGSNEARAYHELGFLISLGPSLLRQSPKNTVRVKAVAEAVPSEAIVFETDAPDQGREPGQLAHPKRLIEIAGVFAAIVGKPGQGPAYLDASHARISALFGHDFDIAE